MADFVGKEEPLHGVPCLEYGQFFSRKAQVRGCIDIDVTKLILPGRWRLGDGPVHVVEIEVVKAQVSNCLLEAFKNKVWAVASEDQCDTGQDLML